MNITVFTIVMSLVWSGIFFLIFYFARKSTGMVGICSITGMIVLYLMCILRLILPVEFPWTKMVRWPAGMNWIKSALDSNILPSGWGISWPKILLGVWGLGALFFVSKYVIRYVKLTKFIKCLPKEKDERILRILSETVNDSGKSFEIRRAPNMLIPCCFGIFKKYIMLPEKEYSDEQLKYILLHESLHLQCNDTGVKLMTNIICSIYWWNPLVYLLRKDMNQSLEIRCDKLVVKYEGMSSREEYLKVLLNEYRYVTKVSMSEKKQFCGMMLFEKHTEPLLERFEQLKANNMKNSRYGLALAVIIGVASLLLSYSFVLQSGFDCPIEEIETAVGDKEMNPEEMYLVECNDGSYILHSGELQQIVKPEHVDLLIKSGVKVYKE